MMLSSLNSTLLGSISLVVISAVTAVENVHGSACCGSGVFAPSIISTDDWTQLSVTTTQLDHNVFVDADGFWGSPARPQTLRTTRLDASRKLSPHLQVGAGGSFLQRISDANQNDGIGDLSLNAAYLALSEYQYADWHPRVHLISQLTAPIGSSRFSTANPDQAFGSGFVSASIGAMAQKSLGAWDLLALGLYRHGFPTAMDTPSGPANGVPGYGTSATMGFGYSRAGFRVGAGATWVYQSPIVVRRENRERAGASSMNGETIQTEIERSTTANLGLSYVGGRDWTATIHILDQTLFGSPSNTLLGRGFLFQYQIRWR